MPNTPTGKDTKDKQQKEGMTLTDIIEMSQNITGDWLKKEATKRVTIKSSESESKKPNEKDLSSSFTVLAY
jgi:hypothetical protein